MFVAAIEKALAYARPIHIIKRTYGSDVVLPDCATLFFVNNDGWALTCRHVAAFLLNANTINEEYAKFRRSPDLGKNFKYSAKTLVEVKTRFMDCIEGSLDVTAKIHPELDLALLKFSGHDRLLCNRFPVFPKDTTLLRAGKSLCRLGFPFPEFTNFRYDPAKDEIEWTNTGKASTPAFPNDGMVTRLVAAPVAGQPAIVAFEMSTPGLQGQSGGPIFDVEGRVWGIQFMTAHLYLGFDVERNIVRDGQTVKVSDSAFLHVGHGVHIDPVKAFMKSHGVEFQEG